MYPFARIAVLAAISVFISSLSLTQASAESDNISRAGARIQVVADGHDDVWAAGALVSVRGALNGELWAAGAEVDVDTTAKGEAWVAGAIVTIAGGYQKDLHVAGARVNVNARVGGKLNAAGARVLIGPQTEVRGRLNLAGADVVFAGTAQGPAEIYGDAVLIEGRIAGDLRVRARSVAVGSGAVIDGNAVFETLSEPEIAQGATIRGRQTVTLPRADARAVATIAKALAAIVLFGIGSGLVLGIILLLAGRRHVERAIEQIRAAPIRTAIIGLALLVLVPLAAVVLMVTVIGLPVGLLTLLAFPLLLLIASVIAALGIADWALNRNRTRGSLGGRVVLLLVGLIGLTVIGIIPVIGFVAWFLALILGLGALWSAMRFRDYSAASAGGA